MSLGSQLVRVWSRPHRGFLHEPTVFAAREARRRRDGGGRLRNRGAQRREWCPSCTRMTRVGCSWYVKPHRTAISAIDPRSVRSNRHAWSTRRPGRNRCGARPGADVLPAAVAEPRPARGTRTPMPGRAPVADGGALTGRWPDGPAGDLCSDLRRSPCCDSERRRRQERLGGRRPHTGGADHAPLAGLTAHGGEATTLAASRRTIAPGSTGSTSVTRRSPPATTSTRIVDPTSTGPLSIDSGPAGVGCAVKQPDRVG